ncbi:hypothetical protein AM506_12285 [Rossellomorea vietnamensis]|uniref:Uncharacterized protein n=1 Tax=Rossellomorea vietnamensis TaxID=218284 RepID=A0A0P6WFP2_9BACI|nr:hypothetical protein AM506_12285 [Rossellomorea vietnamensis]
MSWKNHAGLEGDRAGLEITVRVMGFSCSMLIIHATFQIIMPPCRIFFMRPSSYALPAQESLLREQAEARFLKQCIFGFLIFFLNEFLL